MYALQTHKHLIINILTSKQHAFYVWLQHFIYKKIIIHTHYTLLITRVKPTLTQITRYRHADYSPTPPSLRLTHGDVRLYRRYD